MSVVKLQNRMSAPTFADRFLGEDAFGLAEHLHRSERIQTPAVNIS